MAVQPGRLLLKKMLAAGLAGSNPTPGGTGQAIAELSGRAPQRRLHNVFDHVEPGDEHCRSREQDKDTPAILKPVQNE